MFIKGVLFDFDGTLTLPGALDFPAIKKMLGCPLDQAILEYLELQPPDRRAGLTRILEEKEDDAAGASSPNRCAERCLRHMKNDGVLLGILTRNRLASVTKALERFEEIDVDDFAAVVTREESRPKPHPHGVLLAAGRMGVRPSELLVVGDFRFDVMAGDRAGAHTVLLTNGGESTMAGGDPQPDYMITHLDHLPALLSQNL